MLEDSFSRIVCFQYFQAVFMETIRATDVDLTANYDIASRSILASFAILLQPEVPIAGLLTKKMRAPAGLEY